MHHCKSIGCQNPIPRNQDFCERCTNAELDGFDTKYEKTLSTRYPGFYKPVGDLSEIDVYTVNHLFQIQDPSGCLQDASKKLLLSGSSESRYRDIREARDTLTRWLQLNQELNA